MSEEEKKKLTELTLELSLMTDQKDIAKLLGNYFGKKIKSLSEENKRLSEDIEKLFDEIEKKAIKLDPYSYDIKTINQIIRDRFESLTEENKRLRDWKADYFYLWNPVDEFVRNMDGVTMGDSVSEKALEFLKDYQKLSDKLNSAIELLNSVDSKDYEVDGLMGARVSGFLSKHKDK